MDNALNYLISLYPHSGTGKVIGENDQVVVRQLPLDEKAKLENISPWLKAVWNTAK